MNVREELVKVCEKIGARPVVWTQGAGGNVSVKDADTSRLFIKASGSRLDEVSSNKNIAACELQKIRTDFIKLSTSDQEAESHYAEILKECSIKEAGLGRLSMETGFHALLKPKWIVHFHSLASILMGEKAKLDSAGFKAWKKKFKDMNIVVIPPLMPGWVLSTVLGKSQEASIYILTNHGVVLSSDSPELIDVFATMELSFCEEFGFMKLLSLLKSSDPYQSAKKEFSQSQGAISMYFPDVAVFLDRLNANHLDKDTYEIWLAIRILQEECPELSTLPDQISKNVATLPTELFRKTKQ